MKTSSCWIRRSWIIPILKNHMCQTRASDMARKSGFDLTLEEDKIMEALKKRLLSEVFYGRRDIRC